MAFFLVVVFHIILGVEKIEKNSPQYLIICRKKEKLSSFIVNNNILQKLENVPPSENWLLSTFLPAGW
jgi:hypothetical protein